MAGTEVNMEDGGLNSDSAATQDDVRLLEGATGDQGAQSKTDQESGAPQSTPNADDLDLDEEAPVSHSEEHDAELAGAQNDAEREAIRARRREERRMRKDNAKKKLSALDRQVRALAEQNRVLQEQLAVVQNTSIGQQINSLDAEIGRANNAVEHFKNIIADATNKGDGRVVAEATQHMLAAGRHAERLASVKQAAVRTANAPQPLNPSLVANAKAFMEENKWYNQASPDPDSRVMTALDNSLSAEGWDPTQPEYWEELRTRGAKYLPHRFSKPGTPNPGNNGGQKREKPNSPVAGSTSSNPNGGKGTGYMLSVERVKAMKDAGIWDDPKRRDAMIKRYREADAQQASS